MWRIWIDYWEARENHPPALAASRRHKLTPINTNLGIALKLLFLWTPV
jgi:hypothetical protein